MTINAVILCWNWKCGIVNSSWNLFYHTYMPVSCLGGGLGRPCRAFPGRYSNRLMIGSTDRKFGQVVRERHFGPASQVKLGASDTRVAFNLTLWDTEWSPIKISQCLGKHGSVQVIPYHCHTSVTYMDTKNCKFELHCGFRVAREESWEGKGVDSKSQVSI